MQVVTVRSQAMKMEGDLVLHFLIQYVLWEKTIVTFVFWSWTKLHRATTLLLFPFPRANC